MKKLLLLVLALGVAHATFGEWLPVPSVASVASWLTVAVRQVLYYISAGVHYVTKERALGPHAKLLRAVRAVTADQEHTVLLLHQFLAKKDPTMEAELVAFMGEEALVSRVALERVLDWLLAAYRTLAPFAVIYALMALFRRQEEPPRPLSPRSPPPQMRSAGETPQRSPPAFEALANRRYSEGVDVPLDSRVVAMPERERRKYLRAVFDGVDANKDGQISKREMLLALRRDAALGTLLGMPARVRQSKRDGSYEAFESAFSRLDVNRDDAISWAEFLQRFGGAAAAAADAMSSFASHEVAEDEE